MEEKEPVVKTFTLTIQSGDPAVELVNLLAQVFDLYKDIHGNDRIAAIAWMAERWGWKP